LEQILAPDHLLSDPFLCSSLLPLSDNGLPLSALLADSAFLRWVVDEEALLAACRQLKYEVIESLEEPHVLLPYTVTLNELALTLHEPVNATELMEFLHFLHGPVGLVVVPSPNRVGEFILRFESPSMLLALWRALAAIPFNGEIAEARLCSSGNRVTREIQWGTQKKPRANPGRRGPGIGGFPRGAE
jgi:hypothetical protein